MMWNDTVYVCSMMWNGTVYVCSMMWNGTVYVCSMMWNGTVYMEELFFLSFFLVFPVSLQWQKWCHFLPAATLLSAFHC